MNRKLVQDAILNLKDYRDGLALKENQNEVQLEIDYLESTLQHSEQRIAERILNLFMPYSSKEMRSEKKKRLLEILNVFLAKPSEKELIIAMLDKKVTDNTENYMINYLLAVETIKTEISLMED